MMLCTSFVVVDDFAAKKKGSKGNEKEDGERNGRCYSSPGSFSSPLPKYVLKPHIERCFSWLFGGKVVI